jgi:hypothetical protein
MDYGVMDYGDMNWLAIGCAGLAYWLLGAVWYSTLFSKGVALRRRAARC